MAFRTPLTTPLMQLDDIVETPQKDLLYALSALHFGGKYSDLTITCNYQQWAVHRAIVCSRSGFFDGACSHQFLEATSGVIDLSDEDEEAVEQMIHFFYHLDYLEKPSNQPITAFRHRNASAERRRWSKRVDLTHIEDPLLALASRYNPDEASPVSPADSRGSLDLPEGKPRLVRTRSSTPSLEADEGSDEEVAESDEEDEETYLVLHTRVYALAEKYDIPSLKQLAKRKFEMEMACNFDSPDFAEAIEEVYCSTVDTDRGLRDVVLEAFRNHPQLANTQDVFAVIERTPSLKCELFKVAHAGDGQHYLVGTQQKLKLNDRQWDTRLRMVEDQQRCADMLTRAQPSPIPALRYHCGDVVEDIAAQAELFLEYSSWPSIHAVHSKQQVTGAPAVLGA